MLATGRARRFAFLIGLGLVFSRESDGLRAQDVSESLTESWRWRVFDSGEGIGSSSVSAIHQDRHRYIYAATERGVCRYDLWEWKALENAEPFDDGEVKRFVESPGALFAVTANTLWKVQGGTTLARMYRGGGLVAASNDLGEIYLVDERDERHLQLRGETVERLDDVRLPPGKSLAYEIDSERVHWLATSNGLYARDLSRRAWREIQDRDSDPELANLRCRRLLRVDSPPRREGEPESDAGVSPAFELWAVFGEAGGTAGKQCLARLTSGAWAFVSQIEGALPGKIIRLPSRRLIATAEDGQLLQSADGRQWARVTGPEVGKTALYGGLLDSSGVLWFLRGAGGVAAYDSRSRAWESIASAAGQSFPNVLAIIETSAGDVWTGMSRNVSRVREGKELETWDKIQGTSFEKITGLGEDGLGRVWVSSAESFNGAFSFDPDSETWAKEGREGFRDFPVRRIVRDRAGELWFLSKETSQRGGYTIYRSALETSYDLEPLLVAHGPVNDIARARDDVFWLATDDGLLQGRVADDELVIEKRFTDRDGLLSIQVWAVTEGPDGAIWVCYPSSGGGVTRFKDGVAKSYQDADGLASSEVWSITSAVQSVWIGTGRGLSRFDGECWYSYPVASLDFRSIRVWPLFASRRDADSILLGTFGQGALRYRLEDRRLPRFVSGLTLPARVPAGGSVTFEWDARDYRNQTPHEALLYRSRVDEGAWSRFSSARSRELKELSPGRHVFEVEVRDLAGNRNREELVHRFDVGEPPALNVLLIVGAAAALTVVASLAVHVGARRVRARRRALRYRGLYESFPGSVFFLDRDGRIVEWNGGAPEAAGMDGVRREELIGRPLHLVPAFFAESTRAAVKGLLRGEPLRASRHRMDTGGLSRVLEIQGFPLGGLPGKPEGAVVLVSDRTQEANEGELQELERRLASLRHLAGRVALDFGAVLRLAIEKAGASAGPDLVQRLERAETLTRKLSSFAGADMGAGVVPATDVGETLERLLGGSIPVSPDPVGVPATIKVDHRGQTGLWCAALEPALLETVLGEVLVNAIEAMPGRGTLTVRAQNSRIESDSSLLQPGSYVEVVVKDTGTGMDPAQVQRAFEPFYSTKPREKSLGIGLSIAYGIARARGGDIRLESTPGQGTSVKVFLLAARG